MTDEVKVPFGVAADGRMVTVDAVERGLNCNCMCPACGIHLVAAKGDVYRHHFRHTVEHEGDCAFARETAIHRFAKQIICDRLMLGLPDPLGTMIQADQEVRLGNVVPDVLATYDSDEQLAVEIFVAHQVDKDKIREYNRRRIAAVEIDLHLYCYADKTEAEWEQAILYDAKRTWLSVPEYIRKRRELERAQWLKQQREKVAEQKRLEATWAKARKDEEEFLAFLQAEQRAADEITRQIKAIKEIIRREDEQQKRAEHEALRLKLAAEQEKEWETQRAIRAQLQREMMPPDLQDLVRAHSAYDRITNEGWLAFNRDIETWKTSVAAIGFLAMRKRAK